MADELRIEQFTEIGFEHATFFDPSQLEFRQEVRDMCSADKCQQYGKNWACPPACGEIEQSVEKAKKYSKAVMIQTTATMEDSFDFETMMQAAKDHKERFFEAAKLVRTVDPDCLPMGAGGCNICRKCTYPDEPAVSPTELSHPWRPTDSSFPQSARRQAWSTTTAPTPSPTPPASSTTNPRASWRIKAHQGDGSSDA